MKRIFLSHSSADKGFVKEVFDYFGADRCVYDEMTFEIGMPTLSEIFTGIDLTDIFVFFISDASLNSKWVQEELKTAEEQLNNNSKRLSQIFPIIIDSSITYIDERIPNFLKIGFSSYNLRHILNAKIAVKKINDQLNKLLICNNSDLEKNFDYFYGRDLDKKQFKDRFDERDDQGKLYHIKCMIVSGIEGIGRKAYTRSVLRETEIVDKYYYPMVTSLAKNENIDDLIFRLSMDLGLGDLSYESIKQLGSVDEKIDILADLIKKSQEYREIIIIEDNFCIIKGGEIAYWFVNVLNKINNCVAVVIITQGTVERFKYIRNKEIFMITLQNMERSETFGFLRGYSNIKGIPFDDDDIGYFSQILTGYPLQIQYCVDLALAYGKKYIKEYSYKIAEMPEANSAKILNIIIDEKKESEYRSLLALMAELGTVPITLLNRIFESNEMYKEIYFQIKKYAIITEIGTSGEYIKLNSIIKDYILRSGFEISDDIREILNNNIKEFSEKVDDTQYMNYLSFSEFSYYVKENLKKGRDVPEKFLYSTIYVKTIIDLYNSGERNYTRIVEIVNDMKRSGAFSECDEDAQNVIQFYLCTSLARLNNTLFDSEVSYFDTPALKNKYNFLLGFNFRLRGKYRTSEKKYLDVLRYEPKNEKAKRELVIVYINMQDFDTALELAEQNYHDYPDNLYQMQAYFDCLIRQEGRTEKQNDDISKIIRTAEIINRTNNSEIYFQLKAKYSAFISNDKAESLKILDEGLALYHNSFHLLKDYFDICLYFNNGEGMKNSLNKMKNLPSSTSMAFAKAIECREIYLDYFNGISPTSIKLKVLTNNDLTENAKKSILKRVGIEL